MAELTCNRTGEVCNYLNDPAFADFDPVNFADPDLYTCEVYSHVAEYPCGFRNFAEVGQMVLTVHEQTIRVEAYNNPEYRTIESLSDEQRDNS